MKKNEKKEFVDRKEFVDSFDTYEPKDWFACPVVLGGNPNGFLYDWPDDACEFRFTDVTGRRLLATPYGDGQIALYELKMQKITGEVAYEKDSDITGFDNWTADEITAIYT